MSVDDQRFDYIPIIYNNWYGGFALSKRARTLYKERTQTDSFKFHDAMRADPVLVEIVRELGEEANGDCSALAIGNIPAKFRNHYVVYDYDGLEEIDIDFERYQRDMIQEVCGSEVDDSEKIRQIRAILDEPRPTFRWSNRITIPVDEYEELAAEPGMQT